MKRNIGYSKPQNHINHCTTKYDMPFILPVEETHEYANFSMLSYLAQTVFGKSGYGLLFKQST